MVSYSPEYLAMIIIGGLFSFIGFIGIIISIISLFFTSLSIYSKTFIIVSVILFLTGLSLLIGGVVAGIKKAKEKNDEDNINASNQYDANVAAARAAIEAARARAGSGST